jgi:hypothetical protein
VKKAQAAACLPVTTNYGALDESVQFGVKVQTTEHGNMGYGITDPKAQDEWVEGAVKALTTPMGDRSEMVTWAKKFAWDKIAKLWVEKFGILA